MTLNSTHLDTAVSLPLVIAGPILRHCDEAHFTLWFVTSTRCNNLSLCLQGAELNRSLTEDEVFSVDLGKRAFQYIITVTSPNLLPREQQVQYQVFDAEHGDMFAQVNELTYGDDELPSVIVKPNINDLLHGSCRQAHHDSPDALVSADYHIANLPDANTRPSLLMLSGDQVYVDDIAGPMLYAIGQVIALLGLPDEVFEDSDIASAKALSYLPADMYQRHQNVLPHTQYAAKTPLHRWYVNHPIFTSSLAENHLVSVGEMMALYLLNWSPELWQQISIPKYVAGMMPANQKRWAVQWPQLLAFKSGLSKVRRLMANLPTYMIFDDHDVTDDWNLTAKWEEAAYGHAFSKRIIGNALVGYTLFQGLGNNPRELIHDLGDALSCLFNGKHADPLTKDSEHKQLINSLLKYENWHYSLNTSPKLVVLDTRTRRWRSESNLAKPSGLMDWEALTEFQQNLVGEDKVIIVSPAPMYGVKVIEAIQRVATACGGSLLVDAENWMAHPGTANSLLNIFMHRKTPQEFVILSGDVHYSFSYDVHIRFRHGGPNIYQITCSGIKNQFPEQLLPVFDKLNGWLYGRWSPLNMFTKRKRMSIRERKPYRQSGYDKPLVRQHGRRLVNQSGIGMVHFAKSGAPDKIAVLHGDMSQTVFLAPKGSDN